MLDKYIYSLPVQTLISLFLAMVFFVMGLVLMTPLDLSFAGLAVSTFVFGAVVYLVIDFYETFADDIEH